MFFGLFFSQEDHAAIKEIYGHPYHGMCFQLFPALRTMRGIYDNKAAIMKGVTAFDIRPQFRNIACLQVNKIEWRYPKMQIGKLRSDLIFHCFHVSKEQEMGH